MMKSNRKPPLAKSPVRRRVLRSNPIAVQTPPGSLTKSQKPNTIPEMEESDGIRPEYRTISWELRELARQVQDEFGNGKSTNAYCVNSSPVYERGRFYEVYSARRNERLKRKKMEEEEIGGKTTPYNLGVTVDCSKKRESKKKLESLRKSVCAAYSVETTNTIPRYSLRSLSKENKKPPLAVNYDKSALTSDRKVAGIRRVRKT